MPVIRPAKSDDVSYIKRCAQTAYAPYVARMGKKPAPMVADFDASVRRNSVYVLEKKGVFCGFIVCFPNHDHYFIENMALFPEFQGHGYGRQLMDFAQTEAQALGFSCLELYTNEKMWENLELYPRLSYEEFARHTQDGFARVFFRKHLTRIIHQNFQVSSGHEGLAGLTAGV